MHSELVRTFVVVVEAGSFLGASARLNVSQSTVSARVKSLEEFLGRTLFVRNRGGAELTPAGRRFQRHAASLLRTMEQARQDVGVPDGFSRILTVGGRFGLWEQFLMAWLLKFQVACPDIGIRAEVGFEDDLMRRLIDGQLDIGVMYTPQRRPGLVVDPLFEEVLVLVSTHDDPQPEPGPGYVLVDWGPEFHAQHGSVFPDFKGPPIIAGIGWLGLQHILGSGGSGYFPKRLVAAHIASGGMRQVVHAPQFRLPAYAVYPETVDDAILAFAIKVLHELSIEWNR